MKFLVDECLSPELTKLAHARGFGESSHVVCRARPKESELKPLILDGDLPKSTQFHSALMPVDGARPNFSA